MHVQFVDLKSQYNSIKAEIDEAIQEVIEQTAFVGGKYVKAFTDGFTEFIGAKYCIGTGNGTDAIEIAFRALGIEPGDEVIVPANSFIASSEAVTNVGAQVIFIDCHPDFYTLDVTKLEALITDKTKAILPVHLHGLPAEMDTILQLADKYKLYVVEDCAQAHGALYKGRKVGTLGHISTFSFYPGKNLGAYGDGGAVITNDNELAQKIKMIANHGRIDKYTHDFEGRNSRLDGLQAAILSAKLRHLSQWNADRRAIAKRYDSGLGDIPELAIPRQMDATESVYHLYVIRTKKRSELISFLQSKNIETGIHYPIGLPFQKAYGYLHHLPADFPVTYQYQDEILSLPCYPELTIEKQDYVIDMIQDFYSAGKNR